eukprot:6197612-Pleurochrysis_carterae.AAC.2
MEGQGALGPQSEATSPRSGRSWRACNFAARSSYAEKVAGYQVAALQPQVLRHGMEMEELTQAVGQQRLVRNEITKLKGITEPGKKYFHDDGFILAVDLAIAEAITTAHVSRNQQVPAPFLILARFFRIKLPTHRCKVPHKVVNGFKMTHAEKKLIYIPGKTHVNAEVCASLRDAKPGAQAPDRHAAP